MARADARDRLAGRPKVAQSELIAGVHAVAEALAAGEEIQQIIIGGAHRARDPAIRRIIDEAKQRGVEIRIEEKPRFNVAAGIYSGARHQFVAARVAPFEYADWGKVLQLVRATDQCIVVAIDHIEDPQNLGAILRNAEGAGAMVVILPERRAAPVTAAVRRAAAGAASHLTIARVSNLVHALENLKANGCWTYGLAPTENAVDYRTMDYADRAVLVIGSESKGLHRLVAEICDVLVRIPIHGRIASLNAASAAAVVLFEVTRRHSNRPLR